MASRFLVFSYFRGCFGQVLFPHFSIMDSKTVQRSAVCGPRQKKQYVGIFFLFSFFRDSRSSMCTRKKENCIIALNAHTQTCGLWLHYITLLFELWRTRLGLGFSAYIHVATIHGGWLHDIWKFDPSSESIDVQPCRTKRSLFSSSPLRRSCSVEIIAVKSKKM